LNLSGPIGILLLIVCIPLCPFIMEERKKEGERRSNWVISLPILVLEHHAGLNLLFPSSKRREHRPFYILMEK